MDCKHLKSIKDGIRTYGLCIVDNDICPLCRYCTQIEKVVSADIYKKYGCVKENGVII